MSCNHETISEYKSINNDYFQPTLDLFKYKTEYKPINNNYFQPTLDLFKYKTFYTNTSDCKSHIINTLNEFYDMNSHIIKNNNSLLEQVNRLKLYQYNYNDLKKFIIDNNPLVLHH